MDFTLYTSFPDDLETEWNSLLDESVTHVPFLRYEYLRTWWQTRGGGEWPAAQLAVIIARRAGQLVGIAPLFVADHQGQSSLMLLGSIEVSDYLDLLVRPADLEAFVAGLLDYLKTAPLPPWSALDLYNLLDQSPTLSALEKAASTQSWAYSSQSLQHSPHISLPGDWETYLAGIDKKQRHEIRRKMRRTEEMGVPLHWYIVEDTARLDEEVDAFMALMANDAEKAAFLTPAMRQHMHLTARCAFDHGCLQLAFLEIGGQKAAGYINFDYLNRLWIYNSGLDPRFNEFSPGWVLLGYLLQWANENKRTEFDFMRGDEEYKYRFGAMDRFVMRAKLTP
ncbi:MAG TPA: GNAT family N-acetyltransferase [Longilinea sp.]|nr:GNAT family N-acetyltransferase [Longilinea sp.]